MTPALSCDCGMGDLDNSDRGALMRLSNAQCAEREHVTPHIAFAVLFRQALARLPIINDGIDRVVTGRQRRDIDLRSLAAKWMRRQTVVALREKLTVIVIYMYGNRIGIRRHVRPNFPSSVNGRLSIYRCG